MINEIAFNYNRLVKNKLLRSIMMKSYYSFLDLKKLTIYGTSDMFDEVVLETTTVCNRGCSYCPVSKFRRKPHLMEISLHEKIIKDLKKIGFRGQILYQFYCEPLTDIRLESHILFARKCLPANHIAVYTNGDLLTRKRMDSLFAAGLSKIYVTLHEKKNTEGFRKMYSALTSRQKSRIEIRELDADSLLATRGGLVTVRNRETRSFCGYPSNTLSIDAYGNVVLCCEDYLGKHKFGNLKNRGLRQIWDDEGFRKIRDDTKKGKFILPICKHCTEN